MTLNILLIDDDVVDRQFLSRSFKHSSLDVSIYEAVDGASAIKLLADVSFDCIFLDYRLPDTDGLVLYSLIVEQDLHPSAPFVMLTGEGSEAIAVEAMKNGVHDYLVKGHITPAVLEHTTRSAIEMFANRRELAEARQQLERLALYDELTGLPNRHLFNENLRRTIDLAQRRQESFGVLMIDLDRFKDINDALGHSAGDEALRMFGARLTSVIRRADICARLGGDEFGLILAMGGAHGAAKIVAQKIIDAMVPPFSIQDHDCTLGCSIGIALYPEHGGEEQSLLTNSDAAMYRAKRNGSGYVLCDAVEQRQVV